MEPAAGAPHHELQLFARYHEAAIKSKAGQLRKQGVELESKGDCVVILPAAGVADLSDEAVAAARSALMQVGIACWPAHLFLSTADRCVAIPSSR